MIREDDLLEQLRAGDDAAFATLVDTYHARLVRLARSIVTSREVAEEVVEETWLAVVRGIDRFEGRSSLRTWLLHICVNRARSTAGKENRTSPVDPQGPAADAGWFNSDGSWTSTVEPWPEMVDDRIMAAKLAEQAKHVIEELQGSGVSASRRARHRLPRRRPVVAPTSPLRSHLRGCPNCSVYLEQIRATIATAGRIDPESLDPEVRGELIKLIRRQHRR